MLAAISTDSAGIHDAKSDDSQDINGEAADVRESVLALEGNGNANQYNNVEIDTNANSFAKDGKEASIADIEGNSNQLQLSSQPERLDLVHSALYLCTFTIVWSLLEGGLSIALRDFDEFAALALFGAISAGIVFYRFYTERQFLLKSDLSSSNSEIDFVRLERNITLTIGCLFFILFACTVAIAIPNLVNKSISETSVLSIIMAAVSIAFMFGIYIMERRLSKKLNSSTMESLAACTFACIQLNVKPFVGGILSKLWGSLWWVGSVVALIVSLYCLKECIRTLRYALRTNFDGTCCSDK
jgi:hypothetical protein